MLHSLRLRMMFARSRIRQQPQFAPEQKDFVKLPDVQAQLQNLRQEYKTDLSMPQLFSEILAEKGKVKLDPIFRVDPQRLNKEIKSKLLGSIRRAPQEHKEEISQENEAITGKSHLYQQDEQIEMETEFKKQLFRKKETKRLINKKVNNPQNWLPESSDPELQQYLQAKKTLKNVRISSIMEGTRTNNALELLIQSGLMDNHENLAKMIEKLDTPQENTKNLPAASLEQQAETKVDEMNINVRGEMVQTKDFQKLKQFYIMYQQKNQQGKDKTKYMLDLLNQIRTYEDKTFQKRYDAINFRFKGRVDFNFFTEPELLSYIKHQNIQPKDLLLIFNQNIGRLTKNSPSTPIITPAVASQLYTKTSLYKFPQTQTNSRINMLSDINFIKLERYVFENLDKVDNTFFTDALHSFTFNHFEQQGSIRPKMFEAIARKICSELEERIGYMPEDELGSACRSLCKIPVFREGYLDDSQILSGLSDRLNSIDSVYVVESVCLFASMMQSPEKNKLLTQAIPLLAAKTHDWDPNTVVNIVRSLAPLLKLQLKPEIVTSLRDLFKNNESLIVNLMESVNLNNCRLIAGFLIKLGEFNLKIFNRMKKTTIQTFRKQLCQLHIDTVPEMAASFSFFDYHQKYRPQSIANHSLIQSFFPRAILTFNSAKYLPYHEVAKFATDEYKYLTGKYVAMICKYLSIVGYKNESFYDGICERMIGEEADKNMLRNIVSIFGCFWLQKRENQIARIMYKAALEGQWRKVACRVEEWIDFIAATANLIAQSQEKVNFMESIFLQKIWPFRDYMSNEQRVTCIAAFAMTNPKFQTLEMLDSFVELIKYEGLSLESRLLLRISTEIFKASTKFELSISEKIASLEQLERIYFRKIQNDLQERHLDIGGVLPYDQVYKEMLLQTRKLEGSNCVILEKPWRIEILDKKIVNMLVSYDMIITVTEEQGSSIRLNGLWKLYQQLYLHLGYRVDIVQSYLWRNLPIQPVKSS